MSPERFFPARLLQRAPQAASAGAWTRGCLLQRTPPVL